MGRVFRFVLTLVLGLAVATGLVAIGVQKTARDWFESDVQLRAELAVNGARRALASNWNVQQNSQLRAVLEDITHDERIMGAAACDASLHPVAVTSAFPAQFSCAEIGASVRGAPAVPVPGASASAGQAAGWRVWNGERDIPGGNVHVSAVPVREGERVLGFVILIHDLSYWERRESTTLWFLLAGFGVLAVAAAGLALALARLSWKRWSLELRKHLRGEAPRPEFQPLLTDVHELVDRLVSERETEKEGGAWTPERLKRALGRDLHGEKVVIIANREPYVHERTPEGGVKVVHPASGLVTALEPVMRACSGVWVAHGSGSADRETADANGRVRVPPGEESYLIRRVWLTPEEEKGYYYGFSNEGLWPLCHIAHARPIFRGEDWRQYQIVNQKFADAVVAEVDQEDPIILVQDYHFALAPRLIRERLPRATIITFWHIPWPNPERFGICPWANEVLDGLLGSSILGFHTQFHCNNFLDAVDRFLEARIDREQNAVVQQGLPTMVRSYPISIEWPVRWLNDLPSIDECRASVLDELKLRPDALLGVGVDRLDYTKGVEERMMAVERLLERFPEFRGRFTFVQLAAPSRTIIERYRQLNDSVERLTKRINDRFGGDGYQPIILLRAHHEPPTVFRYYRAADLCYVSSLHDGMNLVAKEFVAARNDERGVLVLSQFTGAAREMTEALVVNPYDLDETASALATALTMAPEEQRERMRAMRAFVSEFNVYRWAGRMLGDAARLRRRERLTGRLRGHADDAGETTDPGLGRVATLMGKRGAAVEPELVAAASAAAGRGALPQ